MLKSEATSEIWNDWATAQLICNQTRLSAQGYCRALEIDPSNASAAGNLGVFLASTGRVVEALSLFERAATASSGRTHDALLSLIRTCRERISNQKPAKAGATVGKEDWQEEQDFTDRRCSHQPSIGQRPETSLLRTNRFSAQAAAPKAGICFQGHIYGGSGYAEEARALALGISDYQIPMQLVPAGATRDTKNILPEESRRKLEVLQRQSVNLSQSVLFQFALADAWDMESHGRWCVVRTMFETDRLPDGVADRCNAMDEVWVASQFNLETYARAGVRESKLRFVPPGVDTRVFRPQAVPLQVPQKRAFNFLSVFDWQQRKGYDVLLRAFLKEFKADEDVALILKVSQYNSRMADLQTEIVRFVERMAGVRLEDTPPIILVNGFIPQQEMPRLYAAADCFVLPTRGEGYGRPFLEALSCEVPVIATGWSGQADFLNHENSYPIDYRVVSVPDDLDVEVFAGHRWAEPDGDHLRQLMRHVFSHQGEARRRAARGRLDIIRRYDWNAVIPRWMVEFQRLLG